MATPPSTAIPASWNPAVPPPPVAGPPLGIELLSGDWPDAAPLLAPEAGTLLAPDAGELAEPDAGELAEPEAGELADPDAGALVEEPVCGLALGDADGLGEELTLTLVDALAEVVATLPPMPVGVTVTLTVTPSLTVGDRIVTGGLLLEVQAESATQASMVVRPQPATVSRTRCDVHAMAVRALIEPPCGPGNDHFPDACGRNRGKRRRP